MQASADNVRLERNLLFITAAFLVIGAISISITDPRPAVSEILFALVAWALSFVLAHSFLNHHLDRRDPLLLPVAGFLSGWSLLLIRRLASNFLLRQTIWLLAATGVFLLVVRLGRTLRWLRRFRYTWLFGGLALLAATLLFGVNPSGYGPRLWLGLGQIYFQPSEPLKLLMIAYLASYLAERKDLIVTERFKIGRLTLPPLAYVGPLALMFGLAIVLLAWQQDLGAAMLFFFTFLAMFYVATARWEYVVAGLALFVLAGTAGYLLSDRIALRVDGWINPWPEATGRAFQIVQSLQAFGAGGILGQGLGQGNPTYIPAVHTDFTFAAIGEEFGLAGAVAIIILYGIILLRGFRIATGKMPAFERLLAAGLTAGLVIQAWVIMAGNVRLAPIAGVTLPFVSYGGSSMLTSFIGLGLLLRISGSSQDLHQTPTSRETNRPFLRLAAALTLGLASLAGMCGYWAVVRAGALQVREDNPRRVLYEQRIVRGRILDREGTTLAGVVVAADGTVERRYPFSQAAPATGYASLRYGTGGIEAAYDAELRGDAGLSAWEVAWLELLHRPPQGRDVQLTIDTQLQMRAQEGLAGQAGAVVLLDARCGEILALASSPTFDPQRLDETWEALSQDRSAPLVNRATQGLYQPGAALQTVIVAEALDRGVANLPDATFFPTATLEVDGVRLGCNRPLTGSPTLADAYAAACPSPIAGLGGRLDSPALEAAVERWGLTTPAPMEITTESTDWTGSRLTTVAARRTEAIGQGHLTVTPLHAALVAATLANNGTHPALHLVQHVEDTEGNWQPPPETGEARQVIPEPVARALLAAWPRYGEQDAVAAHWGVAVAGEHRSPHAWFLGVAPSRAPQYAVAVLLENTADPEAVIDLGTDVLTAAVDR